MPWTVEFRAHWPLTTPDNKVDTVGSCTLLSGNFPVFTADGTIFVAADSDSKSGVEVFPGDDPKLDFTGKALSVNFWVQITDTSHDAGLVLGGADGDAFFVNYDHVLDAFTFGQAGGPAQAACTPPGGVQANQWYLIHGVNQGSGNSSDITVQGPTSGGNHQPLGGWDPGNWQGGGIAIGDGPLGYADAQINNVRLWARAITPTEQDQLYAAGPSVSDFPPEPGGSGFGPGGGGSGGSGGSGGETGPPPPVIPIPGSGGSGGITGPTPIAFECSFAGVELCVPTPEVREQVDRLLSTMDLRDLQPPPHWPGKQLASLANWQTPAYPVPRLGQLFWPAGAKRWSVGYFLATGAQVAKIRENYYASNSTALVLKAGSGDNADNPLTIATMFMLPPRPLLGLFTKPLPNQPQTGDHVTVPDGIERDLYLLVLVDYRYFLAQQGGIAPWLTESPMSKPPAWSDILYYTPAITAQNYTVDGVYGIASLESGFYSWGPSQSLILDAAAANIGRGVYSRYDGTNSAAPLDGKGYLDLKTWYDAWNSTKTQTDRWKTQNIAGGATLPLPDSMSSYDTLHDLILPQAFQLVCPTWTVYQGYEDYYTGESPQSWNRHWNVDAYPNAQTFTTNTTDLDWMASANGFAPDVYFRDTTKVFLGQTTTRIVALAKQLAQDYVYWLMARVDAAYAGICPWTQDGLNDVTFYYAADLSFTRVQGPPLNAYPREFQHEVGQDSGTRYDFATLWQGRPRNRAVGIFKTENHAAYGAGYYSAVGVNTGEGSPGYFADDTIATKVWLTPIVTGGAITLDHSGTVSYAGIFIGYQTISGDTRALYMVGSAALT